MTPATTQLPIQSVTPTLTLDPPAGQIYQGESAGLSCGASSSSPDWTYLWYHENQEKPLSSSDPSLTSYTITAATLGNSGTYWCKIKRGEELSKFSNSVTLAVIGEISASLVVQWTQLCHHQALWNGFMTTILGKKIYQLLFKVIIIIYYY